MKDKTKLTIIETIIIVIIIGINILLLAEHSRHADIRNNELDIKIIELEDRVDSLEERIIRLESMIEYDLLDSKESDNSLNLPSDFNSERVLK